VEFKGRLFPWIYYTNRTLVNISPCSLNGRANNGIMRAPKDERLGIFMKLYNCLSNESIDGRGIVNFCFDEIYESGNSNFLYLKSMVEYSYTLAIRSALYRSCGCKHTDMLVSKLYYFFCAGKSHSEDFYTTSIGVLFLL
jgi:hypothetical protein